MDSAQADYTTRHLTVHVIIVVVLYSERVGGAYGYAIVVCV